MPQTITQKILAAHCGKKEVYPGQFIEADCDVVLGNDITAPPAITEFEKFEIKKVFNKDKIMLVPDHFTPNKRHQIRSASETDARVCQKVQDKKHFFETGCMGVEHACFRNKLVYSDNLLSY